MISWLMMMLSSIDPLGVKPNWLRWMISSKTFLIPLAMILVTILKETLQRVIGQYWSTLTVVVDLGMRAMKVWFSDGSSVPDLKTF